MNRGINTLVTKQPELTLEERVHLALMSIPEYSALKDMEKFIIDERVTALIESGTKSRYM